ncbi:hypothetical protein Q3G72_002230 [Acer saccharum]|nr:hypothetical protein Q3G72_002230 [Acer saccharum]
MGSLAHMVEDCNGVVQLYNDSSVYRSDENIHFPMPLINNDYRLAPEHRLPVAMEDAYSVMKWLQAQALMMSSENGDDAWFNTSEIDFD